VSRTDGSDSCEEYFFSLESILEKQYIRGLIFDAGVVYHDVK